MVLLWVNNHFNDFEGDPAMTQFLEEFENNLEMAVRLESLLKYYNSATPEFKVRFQYLNITCMCNQWASLV